MSVITSERKQSVFPFRRLLVRPETERLSVQLPCGSLLSSREAAVLPVWEAHRAI